jgi:hypothetical protein
MNVHAAFRCDRRHERRLRRWAAPNTAIEIKLRNAKQSLDDLAVKTKETELKGPSWEEA